MVRVRPALKRSRRVHPRALETMSRNIGPKIREISEKDQQERKLEPGRSDAFAEVTATIKLQKIHQ